MDGQIISKLQRTNKKLKYHIKSNYQIEHISTYCIPNAGVCLISIYAGDLADHAKVCRSSLCFAKSSSFCEVCSDSFVESSVSSHMQFFFLTTVVSKVLVHSGL